MINIETHRKYLVRNGTLMVVIVCLLNIGCSGLHIHQPLDLEHAKSAQTHFNNAALKETVKAERERLASVLEDELDLVRRHTLARRDARLVYIIGEGESEKTWEFLENDVSRRIGELGMDMATFQKTVIDISMLPDRTNDLQTKTERWDRLRIKNPQLPVLSCTPKNGAPTEPVKGLSPTETVAYEDYGNTCRDYLSIAEGARLETGNEKFIADIKAALAEVVTKIKTDKDAYNKAMKDYSDALKAQDASEIKDKAEEYRKKVAAFGKIGDSLDQSESLKKAQEAFQKLDLNIGTIIDDLKSNVEIARLEVAREQILAALSAVVDAESTIPRDAKAPTNAKEIIGVLATVGKALEKSQKNIPVSSLLLEAELLRIDIIAAERRKAFFDKTLELIDEAQAAKIQELLYLARVEQLRLQIAEPGKEGKVCRQSTYDKKEIARVFESSAGVDEKCRELVFKLLVAYSNAWTFGRVPQEQIDYRLIALHHDAALDTSEIAFERWEALLGVPIGQLVDLHATGMRPEDIATIINALGLGAIAVGVN